MHTLALLLLPALLPTVLATYQPAHGILLGRSVEGDQYGCEAGLAPCGDGCLPETDQCCPDQVSGCPPGQACWLGSNDVYGCCDEGETCTGLGGSTPFDTSTAVAETGAVETYTATETEAAAETTLPAETTETPEATETDTASAEATGGSYEATPTPPPTVPGYGTPSSSYAAPTTASEPTTAAEPTKAVATAGANVLVQAGSGMQVVGAVLAGLLMV